MVDRTRLPAIGPDPELQFPRAEKRHLANGLRLWSVERRDLPVVCLLLMWPVGVAADPDTQPGLAAFTADLLDEGSGNRTGFQLHEELARLGAELDIEVTPDAIYITLTTLEHHLDAGLSLLADLVTDPRFDEADVARVRALRLGRLRQLRDIPGAVADRTLTARLYGSHPYGHTALGTEQSLSTISTDDLRGFHRNYLLRIPPLLIAVGDIHQSTLAERVTRAWTDRHAWTMAPAVAEPDRGLSVPQTSGWRLAVIDRPGAAQSELRVARVALPRATPDYYTLNVLNVILGGSFVSRINLNLRAEKGYTYGARSSFEFRRLPGPFTVQASVQTNATVESVSEILREIREIQGPRPATAGELSRAHAALVRGYPRGFETVQQIADAWSQVALFELPDDAFERFMPSIRAVTGADVSAAARRHLPPGDFHIVVVGDADRIRLGLSRLGLGEPMEVPVSADSEVSSWQ